MKINFRLCFFIIFYIITDNLLFAKNGQLNDTIQTILKKYIPSNYTIDFITEGKLNQDTLTDYALVVRDPQIRDSIFLLVLFQKSPMVFEKSLKSEKELVWQEN